MINHAEDANLRLFQNKREARNKDVLELQIDPRLWVHIIPFAFIEVPRKNPKEIFRGRKVGACHQQRVCEFFVLR